MNTATKAGGAVLPVVAYEAAWLGDDHMVSRSNIWSGPVHKLVRLSDAQATIDELRAEVERLRKVACAAIEARRRYGWSVEADAAIEALRASLLGDGGTTAMASQEKPHD